MTTTVTGSPLSPVWVVFATDPSRPYTTDRAYFLGQSPNWNYVHGVGVLHKSRHPLSRVVFERSVCLVGRQSSILVQKARIELLQLDWPGADFITDAPPVIDNQEVEL